MVARGFAKGVERLTEKELKKLSRQELLEILLVQSKKIDRLRTQLEEARQQIAEKELVIAEAGSIAEASLSLGGVFEDAQKAADQYLGNIRRMETQTKLECAKRKKIADMQIQQDLNCAKKAIGQMVGLYAAEVTRRMKLLREWDRQMEALREKRMEKRS